MRLTAKQVRAALPAEVPISQPAHLADLARELARREMLPNRPKNLANEARIRELRKILRNG